MNLVDSINDFLLKSKISLSNKALTKSDESDDILRLDVLHLPKYLDAMNNLTHLMLQHYFREILLFKFPEISEYTIIFLMRKRHSTDDITVKKIKTKDILPLNQLINSNGLRITL